MKTCLYLCGHTNRADDGESGSVVCTVDEWITIMSGPKGLEVHVCSRHISRYQGKQEYSEIRPCCQEYGNPYIPH